MPIGHSAEPPRVGWALRVAFAVAATLVAGCGADGSAPARPPVFVISIDTLRADRLPAYGYAAGATPALDRFRADAILFEHAYTTCPLTLPAHSSLLTGVAPDRHGVRDNIGYRYRSDGRTSLPERLAGAGWSTGAAVSAWVLRAGAGLGPLFGWYDDALEVRGDRSVGHLERPGDRTVDAALGFLDRQTASAGEAGAEPEPVFLMLHLFEPHTPYAPPEPFASRLADPYDGEVAAADAAVGRFLDALRERGLYDDALIVITSDHGEGLGDHGEEEHGLLLHRSTLRVPLLVKLPGSRRAGESVEAPAHLLDLFPTVLEVAGLEPDPGLPGISLLGLPRRAADAPGRALYAESFYPRLHFGWHEQRSLVEGSLHLIEGADLELYDMAADPGELENLAAARAEAAGRLAAALAAREKRLAAPSGVSAEEAANLAALGYAALSADAAPADAPLPDPETMLPVLRRVQRGFELAGEQRHGEAVEALGALVAENPRMLDARFQLGVSLAALGRDEEALAVFAETLEIAPQATDGVRVEMARIEARRAMAAEGRVDASALEAAEAHARAALVGLPAEAHALLAQIALARGDRGGALEEARAAVAAEPTPRPDNVLLLARVHLVRGEHEDALAALDGLRRRVERRERPPVPELELERAEAMARLGRLGDAERAFLAEIERFPRGTRAYVALAMLYAAMGRPERIDPLLERMVVANPAPASFLAAAAAVERLGDAAGARRWRERARWAEDR